MILNITIWLFDLKTKKDYEFLLINGPNAGDISGFSLEDFQNGCFEKIADSCKITYIVDLNKGK